MLEKLTYNFDQKNVQFPDTKSNIEQKDFENCLPFILDLLSQLYRLIGHDSKIDNISPNSLESQGLAEKPGLQSEVNCHPETISSNNFLIDKITDLTEVESIEAYLERVLFSKPSVLIKQLQLENSHQGTNETQLNYLANLNFWSEAESINVNEFSEADLANGLLKIPQSKLQENEIFIKFNYSSKRDDIGNLLPDYQQSINQLGSKIISKQNQTKRAKIIIQTESNPDSNWRLFETGVPLYGTSSRFNDFSNRSFRYPMVDHSSNLNHDDTVHLISKQTPNGEQDIIENDKIFETLNRVKEDVFSQKFKIPQTNERIFNSTTREEQVKNWGFQMQFIKNQLVTKSILEDYNNPASEPPTTFRLLSRYYEIPSKIASILNSRIELPARAEIHLQPRSLGMVVVIITARRNLVDITMRVKDQGTWKALETQIAPLREKLSQLGFEETNIDLQLSQWINSQMQNQAENKGEDYQLRRNFLRSFVQLRKNEVRNFQEFVSNIMGVSLWME